MSAVLESIAKPVTLRSPVNNNQTWLKSLALFCEKTAMTTFWSVFDAEQRHIRLHRKIRDKPHKKCFLGLLYFFEIALFKFFPRQFSPIPRSN